MDDWGCNMSGTLQKPRQIQRHGLWSNRGSAVLMKLRNSLPPVRIACVLVLLVIGACLTGCAATSTPPDSLPRNPEPPPSALPTSPPNYLDDASKAISEWRKLLQELIAKPAN